MISTRGGSPLRSVTERAARMIASTCARARAGRRSRTWRSAAAGSSSRSLRERRPLDQRGQLAGGVLVEREQRRADRAGSVADQPARGLDRGGVAVGLEELAERPEAGPQAGGGRGGGVVRQEPGALGPPAGGGGG